MSSVQVHLFWVFGLFFLLLPTLVFDDVGLLIFSLFSSSDTSLRQSCRSETFTVEMSSRD